MTATLELSIKYWEGARRGWADGKAYCQGYTLGEEYFLADEAADSLGFAGHERGTWERGYCHGYRLAAEGGRLAPEHAGARE